MTRTKLAMLAAAALGALASSGCGGKGGIGDSCKATKDCKEPLVCDPASMVCAKGGPTDSGPGTDSTVPGTDAAGPGTDTGMGPGTDTGMGPGTDSAMGPGTDSAMGPGTDSAGGMTCPAPGACMMTGSTCADWCCAYLANCSADNNFPSGYDMGACMTDCAGLSTGDVDCRAYHACFAGTFAPGTTGRDDHCDHGIGVAICG